ncbi:CBS domain-containing protein [Streptomyces silvisoli]|uniref:CBS domain-containing protein n=1 Tax=Streptomyces silvisoli TaxID=3034235 RepID=A0ABT5ZVF5_9ACTN|nr:CBS domain-containing protein [Streptomyces silvisoli]MDF3293605.1 CBS domain-containing protein [Streptomyces silvisoli]
MSQHEHHAAGAQARGAVPGRDWRPDEAHHQETLLRYLGAVASASAAHATERPPAHVLGQPVPAAEPEPEGPAGIQVRDVMDVSAVPVPGDMPFLDIARTLSREHLGSVPVVDAEDRAVGVVSESDLLSKAAVEAAEHRPGPIRRLSAYRLYEKARGETASTLMTSPAITVLPGTPVVEAAWLAARSRPKRLPVVDYRGRLVGIVRGDALLGALVRDDAKIREGIQSRIIEHDFHLDRASLQVSVDNGVVSVGGTLDSTPTSPTTGRDQAG